MDLFMMLHQILWYFLSTWTDSWTGPKLFSTCGKDSGEC